MVETPYNANSELVAMKEDIANRKFRIQLIGMAVTAVFMGAAIATLFFAPAATAGALGALGAGGAKAALGIGMAAVGGITSLITMKELKKLELDEKFLQSYMSGKNYWGEGYREEVLEHGYSIQSPALSGAPLPSRAQQR